MKSKKTFTKGEQIALLVLNIGLLGCMGFEAPRVIRGLRTRQVFQDLGQANAMLKAKGPFAYDEYLKALHQINLNYTEDGLKSTFEAYIAGLEHGIAAFRAGHSIAAREAQDETEIAKKRLVELATNNSLF